MSITPAATHVASPGAERRVRHQARDVLALMAFSLTTSCVVTAALLLLTEAGRG